MDSRLFREKLKGKFASHKRSEPNKVIPTHVRDELFPSSAALSIQCVVKNM
jgi:hypothetical protein